MVEYCTSIQVDFIRYIDKTIKMKNLSVYLEVKGLKSFTEILTALCFKMSNYNITTFEVSRAKM